MKLRINEDYYDNQKISDLLFDIENSGDGRKIDKAYSYIDSWLDNPEDVYNDDYYDFRNASWGTSEKSIIDYLTNILNESVNITKRNINEKETPNIEVKNKGILEVPEGKNVDDLPLSHFVKLANKKGLSKITKALNNLQVWNKNDDKSLSKWAGDMIDKLNKKLGKDESLKKLNETNAIVIDIPKQEYDFHFKGTDKDGWKRDVHKVIVKYNNKGYFVDLILIDDNDVKVNSVRKKFKFVGKDVVITDADRNDIVIGHIVDNMNENLKLKESSDKKSYWKYSLFDSAIERIENSDRYFDERTIRQVKLYPCETEDECYEGDFWPVRKYDYPYTEIFGTKDEAYKELMYYLNNSMYEKDNDL